MINKQFTMPQYLSWTFNMLHWPIWICSHFQPACILPWKLI